MSKKGEHDEVMRLLEKPMGEFKNSEMAKTPEERNSTMRTGTYTSVLDKRPHSTELKLVSDVPEADHKVIKGYKLQSIAQGHPIYETRKSSIVSRVTYSTTIIC